MSIAPRLMMTPASKPLPPVLLLLDISVLLTTNHRDWQQFAAVGTCLLPQVVVEEMQFLMTRAPDPDLERVARDFQRFQATHKWQSTEVVAAHPLLRSSSGHTLSKKARLSLTVAKCAYGVARQHSTRLVVLATNDQSQIQRLQMLQLPNLCGILGSDLKQWSQAGRRPISVVQHWQQMKEAGLLDAPPTGVQSGLHSGIRSDVSSDIQQGLSSSRSGIATPNRTTGPSQPSVQTRPSSKPVRVQPSRRLSNRPNGLSQLISLVSAAVVLAAVGWLGWWLIQNVDQVWQDSAPIERSP